MAQIQKVEVVTDIKCSADKYYDMFRNNLAELPKICPQLLKLVECDEKIGSVGFVFEHLLAVWCGSMFAWSPSLVVKVTIEAIDDENQSIDYKVLGGDLTNSFKSARVKTRVNPKGEGSTVLWSMEYEKASEDVPAPNEYVDYFAKITKQLDAHLVARCA